MTRINLDNLSDNIRYQLEQRAAIQGFSVESQLDSILKSVFDEKAPENSLKESLLAMPDVGKDVDFNQN